ncbi:MULTISPECIES: hypothetical protein [unclassified Nocardioides]|uniref:hypothetical protein n=1 Tax=unclassified Nocardioides TaxID=2615069 RepID=UPI00360EA67A
MRGDDADFAAYLAARWPLLVRVRVLAGCPRAEAEAVVLDGLARCALAWDQVRRADDVDVHVHSEVHRAARIAAHRRRSPNGPAKVPDADRDDDPPFEVEVRRALEAALEPVQPEHREVLALLHVAGLDERRIAEVLDVEPDVVASRVNQGLRTLDLTEARALVLHDDRRPPPGVDELFRIAAGSIELLVPSYEAVLDRARDLRRRRRTRIVAGVAAAAVVIGGLVWWGSRPEPEEPTRVTLAVNPVGVAWYANGVLHLDLVTVELPQLTDLVELAGGAVYGGVDGVVAFVSADGERRVLGHKETTSPLIGSRDEGWVSWVETEGVAGGSGPGLIVYDVDSGLVHTPPEETPSEVVPIALDQGRVYYSAGGTTYSWAPRSELIARDLRDGLIDIEGAIRVYQRGNSIDFLQPFVSSTRQVLPGIGAQLSAGGTHVLTADPDTDDPTGTFTPLLYDVGSGRSLRSGLGPDEVAVDATFGDTGTVVYLVAQRAELAGDAGFDGSVQPLLVLRTCRMGGSCSDVVPIQLRTGDALLAHAMP